ARRARGAKPPEGSLIPLPAGQGAWRSSAPSAGSAGEKRSRSTKVPRTNATIVPRTKATMRRGGMAPASRTGAALLVLSGCLFSGALAQTPDLEAGRAVVVGGEDGSITPCFTCHGLDGVGDFAGAFPRLTE